MTGQVRSCPIDRCANEVTDAVICSDHRADLGRAVGGGLARLFVELNIALRPGRSGSDDPMPSNGASEIRLPISTAARSAQQDMLTEVKVIEAGLRHRQGWAAAPLRGREGPTLVGACAVLADNLDAVLGGPEGVADAQRLLALVGRARFAAGRAGGSKTNRIDLPCPACDMRALRRANGTDHIACAYCGGEITAQQLDDLLDPPTQREAA
jgi:hypothetical protein